MLSILSRISDNSLNLTKSYESIMRYIKENTSAVAFSTLQDISSKIGVSTTTVIRFAREIGYSGYTDMQHDIQKDLLEQMTLPEKFTNTLSYIKQDNLLLNSFKQDIANINLTMLELQEQQIQQAIELITAANNIYVLGLRESYALAHYMMSRISCIKDNVYLIHSIGGLFPEEIIHAKKGDVFITYLFPRYTQSTLNILLELKKRNISVVLITSPNHDRLNDLAGVILPCHVQGISYKNSSAAPVCLTNYIANAIAVKNSKDALNILSEMENMLSGGTYLG